MSHELALEYNSVLIEMLETYIDTDVKPSKKLKAAVVIDQIDGFINHLEQLREVKRELG